MFEIHDIFPVARTHIYGYVVVVVNLVSQR